MRGVPAEDPSCIHNIDELEQRVEKIGFLPLFVGDVSGFSVEEHTVPEDWWTRDPERSVGVACSCSKAGKSCLWKILQWPGRIYFQRVAAGLCQLPEGRL